MVTIRLGRERMTCDDCARERRCLLALFRNADGTRRFARLCRQCVRWHSANGGRVQVVG